MANKQLTKIIGASALAALLYGAANYVSGKVHLPGCSFIELRPQVAIPMFMGAYFGPLAGFISGCLGDRAGYLFSGMGMSYAWNWSIGNGFIGMLPGALGWFGVREIKSIRGYTILLWLIVAASSLPIIFASAIDIMRHGLSLAHTVYTLILPAFITDAVFGLIIVPGMLILARRIHFSIGIRSMLLNTYLMLFAVLTTYAVSSVSVWNRTGTQALDFADVYNIGMLCFVVLMAGLSASVLAVQKILEPVQSLTDAAREISCGSYQVSPELESASRRDDEIGLLARTFSGMANEVYAREEKLKQQVRDLEIEIDKTKQKDEVSKIVDTDYFRTLRAKARELRTKK